MDVYEKELRLQQFEKMIEHSARQGLRPQQFFLAVADFIREYIAEMIITFLVIIGLSWFVWFQIQQVTHPMVLTNRGWEYVSK